MGTDKEMEVVSPQCPKCKQYIDSLTFKEVPRVYEVTYDFDSLYLIYNADEVEHIGKYYCPLCHKEITDDESEVIELLYGPD